MADYNLAGLSSRELEHMVQALAHTAVSGSVRPFGDGRDGGREATCEGVMRCKTDHEWVGYLVIQAKFKARPDRHDASWLIGEIDSDLEKYMSPRGLKVPQYIIVATNVILSPVHNVGGKDRVVARMKHWQSVLGLKGWEIWDYDKLCRLLDGNGDVRTAYAGLVTPGCSSHPAPRGRRGGLGGVNGMTFAST